MKKIQIKYNPYLVETTILVDGKAPKNNSALNIGRKRLQEWIEKLPQTILDEYRDSNITVDFTGIQSDYDDVLAAFNAYEGKIVASCNFHKTNDITNVEQSLDNIFKEIQEGPIPELRDKKIIDAFNKAKDSKFEINVVATMSSGKSTLINALMQKQLMPAANEATTATIVKIIDTDQNNISAVAYDKSSNIIFQKHDVSIEDMQTLNKDPKVYLVELYANIPFVKSIGMKLVLVDTPGPNNSRDKNHEEMTYKMISDSEKSLVLYVMNGQQLAINDEKVFLDYICGKMKEGGKQARERFIFAVNKMDTFSPNPKKDGADCISHALDNVKEGLEGRGIYNPNIFPVTASAALELRINDEEATSLLNFKMMQGKYDELHFDEYYQYSNLPQFVKNRVENLKKDSDKDDILEIRTGIVSIEQAIAQYINKYARTTKINDLILSFNQKLEELSAVAHLEDDIRKDKYAKAIMEKQIAAINATIQSAENAKKRSQYIDNINLTDQVSQKVSKYLGDVRNRLNKMMVGRSNKLQKALAETQCKQLEKDCLSISVQIKVQIDEILKNAYKHTITTIVEEYKKYLKDLNIGINQGALSFNAINLVSSSLSDLSSIIENNTETHNEGRYKTQTEKVFVPSKRKWYNPFSWFNEGDHFENRSKQVWEDKLVDYVDMNEIASEFITPFQKSLKQTEKDAIKHVESETKRLKEHLKGELVRIDKILKEKLDALSKTETDREAKAEEIARKEQNLKWLEHIQNKINNTIKF